MNKQTQDVLKIFESYTEMGMDYSDAMLAIKEALEQPAQEPYGWYDNHDIHTEKQSDESIALYTHPHQWQGLTDDEIDAIIKEKDGVFGAVVRGIEQELKTKNGFSGLKDKNT